MIKKTLTEIADEVITWLDSQGLQQGKDEEAKFEQGFQCPSCKDDKTDNFSVNIETAKWHCFKCKIAGQGLNGPSGLLAALGVSQDAFSFSAKPTAKRRIAERKKAQASEPKKSSPVMSQDELRGLFNTAYQEVIVTF